MKGIETKTIGVPFYFCDGVLSQSNPMMPFYTDFISGVPAFSPPEMPILCIPKPRSPAPINSAGFGYPSPAFLLISSTQNCVAGSEKTQICTDVHPQQ